MTYPSVTIFRSFVSLFVCFLYGGPEFLENTKEHVKTGGRESWKVSVRRQENLLLYEVLIENPIKKESKM